MNIVHVSRKWPKTSIIGLAVVAVLLFAAVPGTARAECVSSTASQLQTNADTALDNSGGAADIRELAASLDANCVLTVRPVLLPLPLLTNQFLVVQFSFAPQPSDPTLELVDREVYVYESLGAAYLDDVTPLSTFEPNGFTVTLDELGITTTPMELGIAVVSWFDDPLIVGDEIDGDYHPELTSFMLRLPVSFTTPPPLPPPASPLPPAPPAAPAFAPPKKSGCVVPKLKGLSVKKAKSALKKAGCKYKLKGKGRVRSFSPKAGTTTDATVNVKCKQKRKRKKRGR